MTLSRFLPKGLKQSQFFMWGHLIYSLTKPSLLRLHLRENLELANIVDDIGDALTVPLYRDDGAEKNVLFMGAGRVRYVAQDAIIRKSFELAGFKCDVLLPRNWQITKAYKLLGSDNIVYYEDPDHDFESEAAALLSRCDSTQSVMDLEYGGVRSGKYALASMMRGKRIGTIDLSDKLTKTDLSIALVASMKASIAAGNLIRALNPKALVLLDRGYTPAGELFDACINAEIPVFTWNSSHKNNSLILKRYDSRNRDAHPSSLSKETWSKIQQSELNEEIQQLVFGELESCYSSGVWYGEVGTQLNKAPASKAEIFDQLNLKSNVRTVGIFPHIFWDATFCWGKDLFENYEEWFLETVKAACKNSKVNWIIKIHPANIVKNHRDGVTSEHSEIQALKQRVGPLPSHVKLITADSDISSLSLVKAIDACVTVRGTIGIEAACFGKIVLTAGTGRYDGKGFTTDSENKADFLDKLQNIHLLPFPTTAQTELAIKYAWGLLICRPATLKILTMEYLKNKTADLSIKFHSNEFDSLDRAPDINAIASWIRSGQEDYLEFK